MIQPVNLMDMNSSELKQFLDSFDHVFSDCDGVIWQSSPLPRSGDFFKLMKKLGKTVHYVSNNSLRTKENYEAKFKSAGIDDGFRNLTIPSVAIVEYLKSINFSKHIYSVSSTETNNMLKRNGFQVKDGPIIPAESYTDFVQYLEDDPDIGAVVFDSDFLVNLAKLYKAITYLRRPEVLFVNGATDRCVPLAKGLLTLGVGVFTDLVGEQTKRVPIQLGKPGVDFGKFAMKRAGVTDPSRVLFIGDMIEQDIGLGKATGFKTLLVLTSVSEAEMKCHKTIQPDFYAPSLGSLIPQFSEI